MSDAHWTLIMTYSVMMIFWAVAWSEFLRALSLQRMVCICIEKSNIGQLNFKHFKHGYGTGDNRCSSSQIPEVRKKACKRKGQRNTHEYHWHTFTLLADTLQQTIIYLYIHHSGKNYMQGDLFTYLLSIKKTNKTAEIVFVLYLLMVKII